MSESQSASQPASAPVAPPESQPAAETTKEKFREALARKNAKASDGGDRKAGGAKQAKAHGAIENRREFRRKSG